MTEHTSLSQHRSGCLLRAARRYLQAVAFAVIVSSCILGVAGVFYGVESVKQAAPATSPDEILVEAAKAAPAVRHLGTHEKPCEETYGIFPCSNSLGGSVFLTLVYGSILTFAAQCIGDGGEQLLDMNVLPPSLIGGILLPVLGAVPDAAIIGVSALAGGSAVETQRKVAVGVGTLAGSTIMLLTIAFSGSLWLGRCDLVDGEAQDEVINGEKYDPELYVEKFDLCNSNTGITHDVSVLRIKWFMLASSLCYLIVQIGSYAGATQASALIGAVVCFAILVVYLIDSTMNGMAADEEDPATETPRVYAASLKSQLRREAMLQQLERVATNKLQPMLSHAGDTQMIHMYNDDGSPNRSAISSIFEVFDTDKNGYLDDTEIEKFTKVVFMSSGEKEVPQVVWDELRSARSGAPTSGGGSCYSCAAPQQGAGRITRESFLDAVVNMLHMRNMDTPRLGGPAEVDESAKDETQALVAPPEAAEEHDGTVFGALSIITFGAILATVFSDTIVDSIDAVGFHTGIPNFVIGFVVCPLASNASELISSLQLASRKKRRNTSVTFAQIYAACTMNNCLCLGIFFVMVWWKNLSFDYMAEVSAILLVTWTVGLCTCNQTTIPARITLSVLLLYPFSLILVEALHGVGVP